MLGWQPWWAAQLPGNLYKVEAHQRFTSYRYGKICENGRHISDLHKNNEKGIELWTAWGIQNSLVSKFLWSVKLWFDVSAVAEMSPTERFWLPRRRQWLRWWRQWPRWRWRWWRLWRQRRQWPRLCTSLNTPNVSTMHTTSFYSPLQALNPIWSSKLSIYMEFDEA
jgi:hypothetical protein